MVSFWGIEIRRASGVWPRDRNGINQFLGFYRRNNNFDVTGVIAKNQESKIHIHDLKQEIRTKHSYGSAPCLP